MYCVEEEETKNGCIWRDFLRLNSLEALVIARANETYVYDSSTLYDREREEQQLKSESGKRKPHIVFYVSHTQSSQGTTRTSANSQLEVKT